MPTPTPSIDTPPHPRIFTWNLITHSVWFFNNLNPTINKDSVRQLAYVAYVLTPNFISVYMICPDFPWFLHSLFPMICYSFQFFSGSYNFILFQNLLLYIWLLFVSLEETDSLMLTLVLKKPLFFHFWCKLFNISVYLRTLANLGCP